MKTGDFHRDKPPAERDSYTRESFTWRRMQSWQIWALAGTAVILAIAGLAYVY